MQDWKYQPAGDLALSRRQRLRSPVRESGFLGRCSCTLWNALLRTYFHYFQTLTIRGRENIPPRPPFILASNHTSHLDALLLAHALPMRLRHHVFPIAAGDTFFERPVVSTFSATMVNALPVSRKSAGRHALSQLRSRLLDEPCAYILFPEGTRSRSGQIAPFRPGIGMLVAQTDVPVIPCHIAGAFAALPANRKIPRRAQISLTLGAPLKFPDIPNSRDGWTRIAQTLHAAVLALAAPASSNP